MRQDDAFLVRQTLAGNKDAFGELVSRYSGLICGLAYHFVGNLQDAEDLAQDSFERAYERLKQLEEPKKFGSWLRQITANSCRTWLKRHSNDAKGVQLFEPAPGSQGIQQITHIIAEQPLPDEIVERKELQGLVRQALDSLSEKAVRSSGSIKWRQESARPLRS
jgi:RNA polymerase sigma-70 factor (ECF subfamily)